MRIFSMTNMRLAGAAALMLLGGCAAGGPPSYRAKTSDPLSYGYTDSKIDASHYAVIYTDSDKDRAENNLHVRAAEVAQAAGFSWFAFDTEGVAIQRKTETQFDQNMISNGAATKGGSTAIPLNNFMPQNNPTTSALFYSAAGRIALLTPEQAKANPKAIEVAPLLAKRAART